MALTLKAWTERPNAGDVFSIRVTAHLTGRQVRLAGERRCMRANLVAGGSILHWADRRSTVWGTGFIDATVRPLDAPRRVLAVRGPATARRLSELGMRRPAVLGDPGVFAPELFAAAARAHPVGVVPHYVDLEHPWVGRMAAEGIPVIDPLQPLETYMRRLTACHTIASSSLHGLVFAHAYGIPAVWVRLSDRLAGGAFKFGDYLASVGLPERPGLDGSCGAGEIAARCELPARPTDREALRQVLLEAVGR